MELTIIQAWMIVIIIALVFLSGLCWCFCCGSCVVVGRSLLRNIGINVQTRRGYRYQQAKTREEEELQHLEHWTVASDDEDEVNNRS